MLGDWEHPISFLFEVVERNPMHTTVRVRSGHKPHRGHSGDLTLRNIEWDVLRQVLAQAEVATEFTWAPLPESEPGRDDEMHACLGGQWVAEPIVEVVE